MKRVKAFFQSGREALRERWERQLRAAAEVGFGPDPASLSHAAVEAIVLQGKGLRAQEGQRDACRLTRLTHGLPDSMTAARLSADLLRLRGGLPASPGAARPSMGQVASRAQVPLRSSVRISRAMALRVS